MPLLPGHKLVFSQKRQSQKGARDSGDGRKLRMEMAGPANGGFGVEGMDDGPAWNQLSLRRTALWLSFR